jgi:hypothetical protein
MMPLGIFSVEDEHGVVLAGPDGGGRQHQGGATAGTTRLHVDDRHAGHAEPAEDLVTGGYAAVGGAAEGGLESALADPGLPQGAAHGEHAHVGGRHAVETPEGVHAHPGDHGHHAAPTGEKA